MCNSALQISSATALKPEDELKMLRKSLSSVTKHSRMNQLKIKEDFTLET